MTWAISVNDLSYQYPDGAVALRGVNLSVPADLTYGLVGANGVGKSTLLLHLNGILRGRGEVLIWGLPVTRQNLPQIRRRVGLVFQNPDDGLFMPRLEDDVAFGPRNLGLPEDEVKHRVARALAAVGLSGFENRSPHHLSLGERKRASLAAALSLEPDILVLDEPTANLDGAGRRAVIAILANWPGTKLIAAHDLDLIRGLCDRVAVMAEGRVVREGPCDETLADDDYLRRLGVI